MILPDERGDVAAGTGFVSHKGDQKELTYSLFDGHGRQKNFDLSLRTGSWFLGL
jgi:hypothetical protein